MATSTPTLTTATSTTTTTAPDAHDASPELVSNADTSTSTFTSTSTSTFTSPHCFQRGDGVESCNCIDINPASLSLKSTTLPTQGPTLVPGTCSGLVVGEASTTAATTLTSTSASTSAFSSTSSLPFTSTSTSTSTLPSFSTSSSSLALSEPSSLTEAETETTSTSTSPASSLSQSAPISLADDELAFGLVDVDVSEYAHSHSHDTHESGLEATRVRVGVDVSKPMAISKAKPVMHGMSMAGSTPRPNGSAMEQGFWGSTPRGVGAGKGVSVGENGDGEGEGDELESEKEDKEEQERRGEKSRDEDETYLDMECGVFERRDEDDAVMEEDKRVEASAPGLEDADVAPGVEEGLSASPRRNTRLERWLEQQSDLWIAPPPPSPLPAKDASSGETSETQENERKERDRIESIRISGVVNSAAMFAVKRKESLREQRARERRRQLELEGAEKQAEQTQEREDAATPTPILSPTATSDARSPSNDTDKTRTTETEGETETESPLLTSPIPSPASPLASAFPSVPKFKQIAPTLVVPPSAGHRTTDSIPNLLSGLAPLSSSFSISRSPSAQNLQNLSLQPFSKPDPSPLLVPSTPLSPTFSASFSFGPGSASGPSSRRNSHQNLSNAHTSTANAHTFNSSNTNTESDSHVRGSITGTVTATYLRIPSQEAEAARADSPLLGCWGSSLAMPMPAQLSVEADLDKPLPLPPAPSPSPPTSMTELPNTAHPVVPSTHQPLVVSSPAAQYQYPARRSSITQVLPLAPPPRPKTAPHSRLSSPFTSPSVSPLPPTFVPSALRHSPHNSGSGNFTQLPIGVNPGSSFTTSGFGFGSALNGLNGQTQSKSGSGTSSPARRYSHQTQPTQGSAMYAQFSQYSFGAPAASGNAGANATMSSSPPMSAAPSRKGSLLRGVKEEGGVVEMAAEKLNDLARPPMQGLRSRSYSTTLSGASNGLGGGGGALRPSTSSGLLGSGLGHHGQYQPTPTPTTSPTAQFHLPTAMLHKSQSLAQLSLFASAQSLGVSPQQVQPVQQQQQQQTPLPPSSPPTRRLSRVPPAAPLAVNHSPPNVASKTHSYNSSVVSLAGLAEDASFVSTATAQQPRPTHSADPSTSLSPARNAVYIDSDAMRERLDELLEMAKVEIEAAEAESVVDESIDGDGDEDTVEGMVDNWMYSYSNSHSRSNSVPLSRAGSASASAGPSGYGTPFSAVRKNSVGLSGFDKSIPAGAGATGAVVPSTPSPSIRPQAQQYVSPASSNGPPPNTPMTAYFSFNSGSPASNSAAAVAAPSGGGFYMSPEASSSQVYIGSGSSGAHSRAGSKESNKEKVKEMEKGVKGVAAGASVVGMTTTPASTATTTSMAMAMAMASEPDAESSSTTMSISGDAFTATLMSTAQDTSSNTPVRPPPAPLLDISEVVESLEAVEKARRSVGNGSAESYGDAYGGFEEEEEDVDFYDGEEDLSTSDEEMMDEAIALARDLGVEDRLEFGGRRSLEGVFEDGADGWEEFEDEEMGVGMVDVDVSNLEDRYATAKRRSVLLAGFTGMLAQNGSLKRKNSVRRASVVNGVKRNGSVGFAVGGSMRRRGSSATGRGRPAPAVAVHLEEGNPRDLTGVGEEEEFGLGNGLAPPSRWSLTSSIQADDTRPSVDGKPTKKKRRSFVPFVGSSGEKEKEKEKEKEEAPVATSPKENTGKKRNRLASFISRLSGVGVGGTIGSPTLMAAAMAAGASPAAPHMDFQSSPPVPVSFAERNGSGLLPSPLILNSREHSPPPPVPPLSPKLAQHPASPRPLGIDVQAANYGPPMSSVKGNSKSVPNSPISPRSRLPPGLIIPPLPTRPVPTPPETASAPAASTLEQPHSAGLWDMPSPVSPSTIGPLPNFSRARSNSAADLLSMRRPAPSNASMANPAAGHPSVAAFSRHPALMKSASASVLGLQNQPTRPGSPDSMTSTDEYGVEPHGDHDNERERVEMMRREHDERWMNAKDGVSPSEPSPEAERVGNALNSLSPSSHSHPSASKSQSPPQPSRPRLKSMTSLVIIPSSSAAAANNTARSKSGFRGLVERMRGNSSAGTTPASSYPSTPNLNGGGSSPQPPVVDDYDLFAPGPDPFAREVPTPTHSPSASLSLSAGITPTAANPGIGGILGRKQPKRKLVITGVGIDDTEAYEAVKSWCESFGELREVTRASNGAMYVDFRKASVADTVCRVQAQVFIKGAGSVALSWYTKKRPT